MKIVSSKKALGIVVALSSMGAAVLLITQSARGASLATSALSTAMRSSVLATLSKKANDWEAALGWCGHPSGEVYIGDFNRDGRDDMLCHDSSSGYKWIARARSNGRFTGTDWEAALGWCSHASGELHIGDFNRDGRDDMLCHDVASGYKWIAYSRGTGRFAGTDWEAALGWCGHASGELHLGDFNGDDRDDMLCHDTASGYKWIAYANAQGRFTGTNWEAALGWCSHASGELHLGDFNGDGRDDMLCHDTSSGHKWVALAKGNGRFTGTDWEAPLGWCGHPSGEVHIGDFNRDNRDDMLCHDTASGYKWIAYAKGNGSFTGSDWEAALGWCGHASGEVHVGDFNRDRRADLLCHDTSNGYKWIILSDLGS